MNFRAACDRCMPAVCAPMGLLDPPPLVGTATATFPQQHWLNSKSGEREASGIEFRWWAAVPR